MTRDESPSAITLVAPTRIVLGVHFSKGVRGVTAARYKEGTSIVVIDPSVRDVFPDSEPIHEAVWALAPVLRRRKKA